MKFLLNKKNILCDQAIGLYVGRSNNSNKGVFTSERIEEGSLIEACPTIIFLDAEAKLIRSTKLYHYYFIISEQPLQLALALGFGSIYNHYYPGNATFSFNRKKALLEVKAYKTIEPGEEITINYNGNPTDPSPVAISKT